MSKRRATGDWGRGANARGDSYRYWVMGTALTVLGCGSDPLPLPSNPYVDAGPCANSTLSWLEMQYDPANCGACANVCEVGARCVRGACLSAPPVAPYTPCGDDPRLCSGECAAVGAAPSVCVPLCSYGYSCPDPDLGAGTTGVCLLDTGRCGVACGPNGTCPDGQRCSAGVFRAPRGDVHLCRP
jgi:hypothetical protein